MSNQDPQERAAGEAGTSTAFTPGPWAYRPDPSDDWGWVRDPRGCVVAVARNPDAGELADYRRSKTDPYEANARLIAAAPDMYEALARLAPHRERLIHGPNVTISADAYKAVCAALSKVESR